jgi:PIN domain nuclease of toxin-antitoxin system
MSLLLDTHTFLWFVSGDPRLVASVRVLIEDLSNEKLLSVASPWEMAIK